MKPSLLAATALSTSVMFLVPGLAQAQTYDWTGFYAGIGLGGAQSKSTLEYDYPGTAYSLPTGPIDFRGGGSSANVDIGFQGQAGVVVYGLEADANILSFKGALSGDDYSADEKITALLSLRGRLGYAAERVLIYGTAGLAAGQASFGTDVGKGETPASDKGIVSGTVLGAGVEYALTDKLSVRMQGKVYDLSTLSGVGDAGKGTSDPFEATYKPRPVLFEAGINAHF